MKIQAKLIYILLSYQAVIKKQFNFKKYFTPCTPKLNYSIEQCLYKRTTGIIKKQCPTFLFYQYILSSATNITHIYFLTLLSSFFCSFVGISICTASPYSCDLPLRINSRKSKPSVANKQVNNLPSEDILALVHVEQNDSDTDVIKPTSAPLSL